MARTAILAGGTEAERVTWEQVRASAVDLWVDCGKLVGRNVVRSADAIANITLDNRVAPRLKIREKQRIISLER